MSTKNALSEKIQMPIMNGYDATRQMRAWEQATGRTRIPILALTAHALKDDVAKALDAGCDGHFSKPIHKKKLFEILQDAARRKSS